MGISNIGGVAVRVTTWSVVPNSASLTALAVLGGYIAGPTFQSKKQLYKDVKHCHCNQKKYSKSL